MHPSFYLKHPRDFDQAAPYFLLLSWLVNSLNLLHSRADSSRPLSIHSSLNRDSERDGDREMMVTAGLGAQAETAALWRQGRRGDEHGQLGIVWSLRRRRLGQRNDAVIGQRQGCRRRGGAWWNSELVTARLKGSSGTEEVAGSWWAWQRFTAEQGWDRRRCSAAGQKRLRPVATVEERRLEEVKGMATAMAWWASNYGEMNRDGFWWWVN
jgi:hypothetical protein